MYPSKKGGFVAREEVATGLGECFRGWSSSKGVPLQMGSRMLSEGKLRG